VTFFGELSRRNVFRVGIAYLAAAWLLLQVADMVLSNFAAPAWIIQALIFSFALGFPFVLLLAWFYELTPEGVKATSELDVVEAARFTGRKVDFAIIALLVLAVGFLLGRDLLYSPGELVLTDEEQPSIAVLPFVNMSSDPEQEYFSDGISEELLNLLAQVPNFRVISRSSAFSFKGKAIDIPTVAEQLNVRHVLEGSVRKSGDQVRITVQLIDARSDAHLWSGTYDRTLEDIFAVQDEIAASVLEQLQVTLLDGPPRLDEIDPEAYALLLQAKHILDERTPLESLPIAEGYLRRALEIEPEYARAIVELARLRHQEGRIRRGPMEEPVRLTRELLDQALEVDPENAFAYGWLAWLARRYDGDLAATARYLERALALDPTNTDQVGGNLGNIYILGQPEDAIRLAEYVRTHDPMCRNCYRALARFYRDAMRLDEAEATLRSAMVLHLPDNPEYHGPLGELLLLRGEPEAALAEFQQMEDGADRAERVTLALYDLGRSAEFEAAFNELRDPHQLAVVYAYLGNVDAAFEWLERAFDTGFWYSIARDPFFSKLHTDPRWEGVLERMGIAPAQLAELDFKVTLPE